MAIMSCYVIIFSPTGVGIQQTKGRKWRRRQPGKVVNWNPKLKNPLGIWLPGQMRATLLLSHTSGPFSWIILAHVWHGSWFLIRSVFDARYDMDFDDDVLYCYEIQLEESCRGKGLGKFMMKVHNNIKYCFSYCWRIMTQVLELLTIKAGLLKTMLTVFKHNTKAVTFFKEASYPEICLNSTRCCFSGPQI